MQSANGGSTVPLKRPGTRSRRVAARIRSVLQERGLSQTWLASRLNMSGGGLSGWLTGVRGISLDGLQAIADALELPIATLLEEDPAPDLEVDFRAVSLEDPDLIALVERLGDLDVSDREGVKRRIQFELEELARRSRGTGRANP